MYADISDDICDKLVLWNFALAKTERKVKGKGRSLI